MHSAIVNNARLREDLSTIIESKELGLSNLQKGYLRSRWMEEMLQLSRRHNRALRGFYALRLATVLGCLLILMLVSVSFQEGVWDTSIRWLTIFFSLFVSACVVIEHLFNFSESYLRHERTAERLKGEGWRFLQLSGSYQIYTSHSEAFPVFANKVESLNQSNAEEHNFGAARRRKADTYEHEAETPKKYFPLESTETAETPAKMRGVVNLHTNPHRAQ